MIRLRLAPFLISLSALGLGACASTAQDVPAKAIPMSAYEAFQCQELASEFQRVSDEADRLSDDINQGVMAERIKMGVGVMLFWPALLLMDGETENHTNLAHLKGERQTLANSLKARNCQTKESKGRQVKFSADRNSRV